MELLLEKVRDPEGNFDLNHKLELAGMHFKRRLIERARLNEFELLRLLITVKAIREKRRVVAQVIKNGKILGYALIENGKGVTFLSPEMLKERTVKVRYRIYLSGKTALREVDELWRGERKLKSSACTSGAV